MGGGSDISSRDMRAQGNCPKMYLFGGGGLKEVDVEEWIWIKMFFPFFGDGERGGFGAEIWERIKIVLKWEDLSLVSNK